MKSMYLRIFLISIIAWIQRIFLFSKEEIFPVVWEAEQNMPKILDKGVYGQRKIGRSKNVLSSVRGRLIALLIVVWIHVGNVPWVRNFFVKKNQGGFVA